MEFTAHGSDETLADRQPKTGASSRGTGACLPKGLENLFQVLLFDSDSCIAHFAIQPFALGTAQNQHHVTLVRKLDSISQEIQQNLAEVPPINDDVSRHIRVDFD